MSVYTPTNASLIPEIGSVSQAARAFRVAWVSSVVRGHQGETILGTGFVAQHAQVLTLIDARSPEDCQGPMGTIPGALRVGDLDAAELGALLPAETPVVIFDSNNERAPALARALEASGAKLVAHLWGGMNEWRAHGYAVTRELPAEVTRERLTSPMFDAHKRLLSRDDILAHLGDPKSVQRQKLASLITHGKLSCVDGRDSGSVMGTPGGDGGELLLALSVLEQQRGVQLGDDDVARILLARLDSFGHFGVHSDIASANRAIVAIRAHPRLARLAEGISDTLGWRRFWNAPPVEARADLVELAMDLDHVGCGHLKLSLQRAAEYGTRPELVRGFLRAFFQFRFGGSSETEYAPLPGGHAEGAVLRVRTASSPDSFDLVPLVSPMCNGTQMFVAHPEVAQTMRKLMVQMLVRMGEVPCEAAPRLEAGIAELAATQQALTLRALGLGLPIFDVWLDGRAARVESAGVVA